MKINDKIKFYLDGAAHAYGEGIVVELDKAGNPTVELTTPCKEFPIGKTIYLYLNGDTFVK